jgi:hypothetical protein
MSSMAQSMTPMQDAMQAKVVQIFHAEQRVKLIGA